MTADRYRDEVLVPWLEPHMDGHALADRPIFQQDKAPPHTTRLTTAFLQNAAVDILPWPCMSPDMNIIEHLWSHIASEINMMEHMPATAHDLRQCIHAICRDPPRLTYRIWSGAADVGSKLLSASMEASLNTDCIRDAGCIRTLIFPILCIVDRLLV